MAEQDKWGQDRGRYTQEDRFRRGRDASDRRGGYSGGPGQPDRRARREEYGDYGRSFERDRSATGAYGAAYGIDEGRYDEGDPRYGSRWGGGPDAGLGEGDHSGRDEHARGQSHGGQGWRGGERRHEGDHDRTWMERAGERVASWFGGGEVQRDHRGRGPKNYTRSDERIREDVNDRLTDDPWLDASEIEVQVASGEVTLTGTVDNRQDKRRAEDLAEQVSGVRHVQNNLRVSQATTSATAGTAFGGAATGGTAGTGAGTAGAGRTGSTRTTT